MEFLAARGGPFYELQLRLGLLHERSLRVWRRAAIFVGLAWGVPLLISAAEGHLLAPPGKGFLLDIAVLARFVLAVGLFVIAEGQVEPRLRAVLNQLRRAPLIAPASSAAAARAVVLALKRRDSALAEVIFLAIAIVASLFSLTNLEETRAGSWAFRESADGSGLTLAAWWCLLVSSPILWFLLLRELWRHTVWGMLLYDLSKEELRLVVTHPDGRAGLAFLGRYPNAYALFILGISSMIGAVLARQLHDGALAASTLGMVMAVWLAIVLALFIAPLTAFSVALAKLKEEALSVYGSQATAALRIAERKMAGRNVAVAGEKDAEGQPDIADPSKAFEAARKMSISMLNRSALLPLAAAALLPLAAAGVTVLPYKDLLSILKKLLLL